MSKTFIAHSDNGPELAITISISEEIDTPDETTAEKYGVAIHIAHAFNTDLNTAVERARIEGAAKIITEFAMIFLERCKNRDARDMALAFAFGVSERLNGIRNLAHAARILNCTRQLLTEYKRRFDKLLPPGVRIYGKSSDACKTYTNSRLIKLGYRKKSDESTIAAA